MTFDDRDPDETLEPWQQKDEPPSKPLPAKRQPLAALFGVVASPPPCCPKCGGEVAQRPKDAALWCRSCDEGFYRASPAALLFGAGLWFL